MTYNSRSEYSIEEEGVLDSYEASVSDGDDKPTEPSPLEKVAESELLDVPRSVKIFQNRDSHSFVNGD